MKCNFCNTEMETGYIPATKALVWKNKNTKNMIKLSKVSLFVQNIDSFYCPKCNLVIIPIKNNSEDQENKNMPHKI